MAVEFNTNIPEALYLANVKGLPDYDDETSVYLAPTEEAFTQTVADLQTVWDTRAVVEKDTTRTPDAVILQVDAFASKYLERITRRFDSVHASLGKQIDALEAELTKPVESNGARVVATEIRAHCKSLGTKERGTFIEKAIRSGDEATIGAVLGGPAYLSGLDPEMQGAWTKMYRRETKPVEAKRLRALTAARDMIGERAGAVFDAMEKAVGAAPHVAKRLREAQSAAEKALIMKEL